MIGSAVFVDEAVSVITGIAVIGSDGLAQETTLKYNKTTINILFIGINVLYLSLNPKCRSNSIQQNQLPV